MSGDGGSYVSMSGSGLCKPVCFMFFKTMFSFKNLKRTVLKVSMCNTDLHDHDKLIFFQLEMYRVLYPIIRLRIIVLFLGT